MLDQSQASVRSIRQACTQSGRHTLDQAGVHSIRQACTRSDRRTLDQAGMHSIRQAGVLDQAGARSGSGSHKVPHVLVNSRIPSDCISSALLVLSKISTDLSSGRHLIVHVATLRSPGSRIEG